MFRFRERKESAGTRTCELPGKPGRKCIGALHRKIMEELYAVIEKKIKDSGYPRKISGADVYEDICDQIEGKENGNYILLSKFEDDVIFEYHITVMDDDFNLGVLTMRTPEGVFETDFDE